MIAVHNCNVTREIVQLIKVLETEIVGLQELTSSTGNEDQSKAHAN